MRKPPGMTSHDVVNIVRRLAGQRHVGHAGTLDPAAEGVLLACVGKATKVVEYLVDDRKAYRAEITLGVSTDTYDAEGRVLRTVPAVQVSLRELEAASATFRGVIMQVPPSYSAIKRAGQPIYKLARAGTPVTPEPRRVTIYRLEVVDWQPPVLTVDVECSKGTYIRSIAHDLGEQLGCGAHLSRLLRVASGRFSIDSASTIDELAAAFAEGRAEDLLFALDEALLGYDAIIVGDDRARAVRNGQSWAASPAVRPRRVGEHDPVRVYSVVGEIVAMAVYDPDGERWQPSKVF